MQGTIYVNDFTYQTIRTVQDLNFNERLDLCEEIDDLNTRDGYYLMTANKLLVALLPADAVIKLRLSESTSPAVSMPAHLRGCIFERAPNLPAPYAEIVRYWSGPPFNRNDTGAAYFQCPLNTYLVDLGDDPVYAPVVTDRLLSEGVVLCITDLLAAIQGLDADNFVEVSYPIDVEFLGTEAGRFQSADAYGSDASPIGRIYLKVSDILVSPDPDRIYIDLLRSELIDYGYHY